MAHALWVETNNTGKKGVSHSVKVYFAEVGESWESLSGKEWSMVKNFELWLQSPDGKLNRLEATPQKDYYQADFIPSQNGTYQIIAKNTTIGPLNFPNTPAFVPYFYAKSNVQVGNTKAVKSEYEIPLNFTLKQNGNQKQLNLTVPEYVSGKTQVTVFTPSGELKTFNELKNGLFDFVFAEKGNYQIELQYKDDRSGKDYQFAIYTLTSNLFISK
ncbi:MULTISPECIES: hypothetical protein [Flavobacterium]|uniref:hypothetical protein n=1 Tax=Flavobacterium TaxID=237 RepID=UPI001181FE0C|nr:MULTISPECIES: hypothetical protein [Flavobacterium]MCR4033798.1 hypothetical protein [Flavobacterium panacis]